MKLSSQLPKDTIYHSFRLVNSFHGFGRILAPLSSGKVVLSLIFINKIVKFIYHLMQKCFVTTLSIYKHFPKILHSNLFHK